MRSNNYIESSTHAADLLGESDEIGLALRDDGLHEAWREAADAVVEVDRAVAAQRARVQPRQLLQGVAASVVHRLHSQFS